MILEPRNGQTVLDRASSALTQSTGRFDMSSAPNDDPQEAPGFVRSAYLSGLHYTVLGTIARTSADRLTNLTLDQEVDPDWNPYDLLRGEGGSQFLDRNPYLTEAFTDGRVLDFPNQETFWLWANREEERFNELSELQRNGTIKNFIAMAPGQILDAYIGGRLVKGASAAAGVADPMAALTAWRTSGSLLARTAKSSGTMSVLNAAQELGIRMIDRDTPGDTVEAIKNAAAMGALFGGMIPLAGAGLSRTGAYARQIGSPMIRRITKNTVNSFELTPLADVITAAQRDVESLDALLKEPVTGEPRQITILKTPDTLPLIEKARSRFGDRLSILDHPQQVYYDHLSNLKKADAAIIGMGDNKAVATLRAVSPGYAMAKSDFTLDRKALRLFFDEATPTAREADAPVMTSRAPHAEGLKWFYDGWKYKMIQGVHDSLDEALKSGRQVNHVLSNGRQITVRSRWGMANFERAISDHIRVLDEVDRKVRPASDIDKADPAIRAAAEHVRQYRAGMLDEGDLVGMLPGKRALAAIDAKVTHLKARLAKLNDIYDRVIGGKADNSAPEGDLDPFANLGNPDKPIVTTRYTTVPLEWHNQTLYDWGQKGLRTRGNYAIRGTGDRPRKAFADKWLSEFTTIKVGQNPGLVKAIKQLTPEVFPVKRRKGKFWQTKLYMVPKTVLKEAKALLEQTKATSRLKPAILKTTERLQAHEARSKAIAMMVDDRAHSLPRRWLRHVIAARPVEFMDKLVAAWKRNREVDFFTGERIEPELRKLVPEVVNFEADNLERGGLSLADRKAITDLAGKTGDVDKLAEADIRDMLGDDIHRRYLREVDIYFDRAAKATRDTLTNIENAHGVAEIMDGPNPTKSRLLQINETDFYDFLDQDLVRSLDAYHHHLAGRFASRLAIIRNMDELRPIVKTLTGHDLIDDPSPQKVIEAVRREKQLFLDEADRTKNVKASAAIAAADRTSDKILTAKIAELEGRPMTNGANPALESGWALAISRSALRFPGMAYLGKAVVSNIVDLAGLVFLKAWKPEQFKWVVRGLNLAKELPRRQLEYYAVAMEDAINTQRAMELADLDVPLDPSRYGYGRSGRSAQAFDRGTDYASRQFFRATGLNRWNTNMKRAATHMLMGTVTDDVRKMAKANYFAQMGMKESEALYKAGISQLDAVRMNRLGLSGNRAAKVVDALYRLGVNYDGDQPWKGSTDAFDRYKGAIYPEFAKWMKDERELAEIFSQAINSEVRNIILEPKIMTRPVSQRGNVLQRAFHQFQSFSYAFGNQLAPVAAQRPATEVAAWALSAVALGAVADAIHNQLSGRRRIDDTISQWTQNPIGMMYAGVNRSGLTGWLNRPIGFLDSTPWGPGKLLGNQVSSMMYAQGTDITEQAAPLVSWAAQLSKGLSGAIYNGDLSWDRLHSIRTALPFQNLLALSAIYEATRYAGVPNPVGPGKGLDIFPLPTRPPRERE